MLIEKEILTPEDMSLLRELVHSKYYPPIRKKLENRVDELSEDWINNNQNTRAEILELADLLQFFRNLEDETGDSETQYAI